MVGTYSLKTFSKLSELPIIHQMSKSQKTSTVEEVCKKELDTMRFRRNEVNFVATFGNH